MQPLDAGVTAGVKRRHKRQHLLRFFENLEARAKRIYNVDILTASCWTETK